MLKNESKMAKFLLLMMLKYSSELYCLLYVRDNITVRNKQYTSLRFDVVKVLFYTIK